MSIYKWAAIGSNGRGPVVWGIGVSPEDARRDAREEAAKSECDPELSRVVAITPEQASRIQNGQVDVMALGLGAAT